MDTYSRFEPISRRNRSITLPISLRGSLAAEYARLRVVGNYDAAKTFLDELIISDNRDLIRVENHGTVVIGLASERGQFPPDW